MNRKNPEILAPAGDFNTAIHALKNGADAVYLGLTQFSARKSASNFTLNELRHLKTFCITEDKKIYVALNTLVHDHELSDFIDLIINLDEIGINGVIVQDLGVINIIKKYTKLELHASTQLAVHNKHGVMALKQLGFVRAVLSRELTFSEIKYLREEFPKMEFEIFIHGALCYGFSGLCLASSKLLNRSGNRGECGQICRSWFNSKDSKGYYFSLNDVAMGDNILKLKEIGIDSLKIEGRMKSPNYALVTSKLYFNILNGLSYNDDLENAKTEFSRSGNSGYFNKSVGGSTINRHYPGHMGIKVGDIISTNNNQVKIKLDGDGKIENRDGLLILTNDNISEPIKFAANIIQRDKQIITLNLKLPKNVGSSVYKVSDHNKYLKIITSSQFKKYKTLKNLKLIITDNELECIVDNFSYKYEIINQESLQQNDITKQFEKVFFNGSDTNYSFKTEIINKSNFDYPFIQASLLKEIRNKFLISYVSDISNFKISKIDKILNAELKAIPSLNYKKNSEILPFVTDFNQINIKNLNSYDGYTLLPLSPVTFDSDLYLNNLNEFITNNPEVKFIVGLNNIGHFEFLTNLPEDTVYYIDYGIYSCNKFSNDFLANNIKNVKWVTNWVEEEGNNEYPPIFISRTCFKSQEDGCPINCNKEFSYNLSQQNKKYNILVKDCITYTFANF